MLRNALKGMEPLHILDTTGLLLVSLACHNPIRLMRRQRLNDSQTFPRKGHDED